MPSARAHTPARRDPFTGASYLFRGLALLNRPGVRRYVVAPLLINVSLLAALLYLAGTQIAALSDFLERWLPGWLDWLSWLLLPLVIVVVALLSFFGFAVVGNFEDAIDRFSSDGFFVR